MHENLKQLRLFFDAYLKAQEELKELQSKIRHSEAALYQMGDAFQIPRIEITAALHGKIDWDNADH